MNKIDLILVFGLFSFVYDSLFISQSDWICEHALHGFTIHARAVRKFDQDSAKTACPGRV